LGVTVLPLVPTYVSYLIERDPYTDVSNSLQTVSYVLATAGLLIGPRAGHLYLGDRSLTTTCVRTTAALSGSASFLLTLGGAYHHNDTYATIGMTGLWISGIVFLGATIYDFATIPLKVNNYNKNFKKNNSIHLIPGYNFENNGFSLSLTWNF
jgi:hypothetical protein